MTPFSEFYCEKLVPVLEELDQKRKRIIRNLVLGLIPAGLAAVLIAVFLEWASPPVILLGAVLVLAAQSVWPLYRFFTSLVPEFKRKVIGSIVEYIDADLEYRPGSWIRQSVFESSGIFITRVDKYEGDDLVTGRKGNTDIEFSEVHAYKRVKTKNGYHYQCFFNGIFFVADFNKKIRSRTVVLPDTAEKLFGNIGTFFQSWNITRNDLVKLEDPEFERLFVVYGDDQIEARYALSTSLMQRIVDFRNKSGHNIYLSFHGTKIYVAIAFNKAQFEPSLFRSFKNYERVSEYYDHMALVTGIVEDLNLNTRIWGEPGGGQD